MEMDKKKWLGVGAVTLILLGGGVALLFSEQETKPKETNTHVKAERNKSSHRESNKKESEKDIAQKVYAHYDVPTPVTPKEMSQPQVSNSLRQEALQTLLTSEKQRVETLEAKVKEQEEAAKKEAEKAKELSKKEMSQSPPAVVAVPNLPNAEVVNEPKTPDVPEKVSPPAVVVPPQKPITAPEVIIHTKNVIEKGKALTVALARSFLDIQDTYDKNPNLSFDLEKVNTEKAGIYNLPFTVINSKGGKTTGTIPVWVNTLPKIEVKERNLSFSIGSKTPNWLKYVEATDVEDGKLKPTIASNVNMEKEGNYNVVFTAKDRAGFSAKEEISVQITNEAPVIATEQLTYHVYENLSRGTLKKAIVVKDKEDLLLEKASNIHLSKSDFHAIDWAKEGNYSLKVTATDFYGKQTDKTITIHLFNAAPIFTGVEDVELFVGEDFDLLENVRAIDPEGKETTLEVSGEIDTQTAGVYEVTYIATDEDGKTSQHVRRVTVKEKEEEELSLESLFPPLF